MYAPRKPPHQVPPTIEQRLAAIIAATPVVVFALDREGRFTLSEGKGLAAAGLKPGQLVGASVYDLYRDQSAALEGLRRAYAGEESTHLIATSEVVYETHLAPLRDESGLIIGVIGVSHDVTERESAARALRVSEQRLALALEATRDAVWEVDYARRSVHLSARWYEMLGYERDDIPTDVDAFVAMITHPEDLARVDELVVASCAGAGALARDVRLRHKDGSYRLMTVRMRILDPDGPTPRVVGVNTDVTEIRAEEARRTFQAALLEAQTEASTDGVLVVSPHGRILSWNRRFADLWRLPEDVLASGDDARVLALVVASLADPDGVMARTSYLYEHPNEESREELVLRDGRTFERHSAPVVGKNGELFGRLWRFRDVTEQKQLHAQLIAADRMVAMGTLAAGVAHEINNPLTYVLMNLSALLEELGDKDDAAHALLHEALEGAGRVADVVRDLKAFSRVEEERRTPVDVRDVLDSALRMAHNELRHRASVVRDYAEVPPVLASTSRLAQVFLNLLLNAAHAIEEGRASQHRVTVTVRREAASVVVEVSDSGVGIRAETLEHIFEPFFTTKPVGVGTGLGLAICRSIVIGLGGEISASSKVGHGSTFRVVLPAHEELPARTRAEPVAVEPRGLRVLIIDDEPSVAHCLARLLARTHHVSVATRGDDALAKLANERFDTIFCDLMMPERSGAEIYERVAATDPEHARRFVFMTGGAFTDAAASFLAGVANPKLNKPFTRESVAEALRAVAS